MKEGDSEKGGGGENSPISPPLDPCLKWAIDSEAMRARGIIVLIKSNQLVKNIETIKQL